MDDLISRRSAIEALIRISGCESKNEIIGICAERVTDSEGWLGGILEGISELEDLPSAQPERKKGRWFFSETDSLTHCSNCGQSKWKGYCPTPKEATEWMPICPKCGARMEGEQNEI